MTIQVKITIINMIINMMLNMMLKIRIMIRISIIRNILKDQAWGKDKKVVMINNIRRRNNITITIRTK